MPEVNTINEREEKWLLTHLRFQSRPAGLVALIWVCRVFAVLALCIAVVVASFGLLVDALQPLLAAFCCAGVAEICRQEMKPEFSIRRWRVLKACETIIVVVGAILIYMIINI